MPRETKVIYFYEGETEEKLHYNNIIVDTSGNYKT